jgi:GlcNAc-PI de-N-acetylase
VLRLAGAAVEVCPNVTDVDDRLLVQAQRDGVAWSSLATQEMVRFERDMAVSGVLVVDLAAASVVLLGGVADRGPVLAVVAHPDDESFGLGAILAALVAAGAEVRVVCLAHGEASTLGATHDLAAVRHRELTAAAERLGVADVVLHDFPDGRLSENRDRGRRRGGRGKPR